MADKETVKVIVRCRPLSDQEVRQGRAQVVQVDGQDEQITLRSASEGEKRFAFDQAFGPDSRQEDVYAAVCAPLVEAVLQGFNACVFAYGQTGCGKTHTMEGRAAPAEARGIIPRAFDHIFSLIETGRRRSGAGSGSPAACHSPLAACRTHAAACHACLAAGSGEREFLVRVSHLEIYNEEVRDLLSRDAAAQVELRESPGCGVHVRGLKEFVARSAAEMAAVLEAGSKNRTVGATLMNHDSSRSHSIFTIVVETVVKAAGAGPGQPPHGTASPGKAASRGAGGGAIRVGKLHLVDLAGSERQAKTGATGERLREATRINLSLSALGNVIAALTDPAAAHVPYRDSKLTRLLQARRPASAPAEAAAGCMPPDSLGGNSKTVMIANVGPADHSFEETLSTLRYAARAKLIKNKPRVNEDPKDAMLREFQAEIERLKAELARRQQQRAASAAPRSAPADQAAGSGGGGPAAGDAATGADACAAATRQAVRADLERQLRQAATVEALAKARQGAEQAARQRVEDELSSASASLEEQRHAAALLAAQAAEAQAGAAEVLRGGHGPSDQVEALEAAAAQQRAALARQRAAAAAREAQLARLEEAAGAMEGRHSSVQEEVASKKARLQRVAGAAAAARREARALAGECQAERERMLDDIRRLTDLLIGAYIPAPYQQLIMSRCHVEEGVGRWSLDHIQCAGNLARARREGEASLSGSDASSSSSSSSCASPAGGSAHSQHADADGGFGRLGGIVLHGASDALSNVYFTYPATAATDSACGSPSGRAVSRTDSPLTGRPRTAALAARQALRRPLSVGGLQRG